MLKKIACFFILFFLICLCACDSSADSSDTVSIGSEQYLEEKSDGVMADPTPSITPDSFDNTITEPADDSMGLIAEADSNDAGTEADETEVLADSGIDDISHTQPEDPLETVVATTRVKIRKEPNTECDVLGMLNEGDRIERYEAQSDGWSKVSYEGQEGYIKSDYILSESDYLAAKEQTNNQSVASATQADSAFDMSGDSQLADSMAAAVPLATAVPETTQPQPKVASGSGDSNFNTYNNAAQQITLDTWVLNTNTKKIHHPGCNSVKKIAPHNYSTSSASLQDLFNQGYTTCGNCF